MANEFGEVAERLRRSTVQVRSGRRGAGSGVIWDGSGTILTNAHVATSDHPAVELWDGRELPARVTFRDPRRDLAALEVAAPDLLPAEIGDSASLRPGALVIAIGNPLGFVGALTRGVVYGLGPVPGLGRQPWLQADVQLAPGNSGGPLADAQGRVVGINAMIWRGLGLSVPSNAVVEFLRRGSAAASRVELGIVVQAVTWNGRPGLLILEVRAGSPASDASLMLGDVLVGTDFGSFTSPDDLLDVLESGQELVHLEFVRGDRRAVRSVAVRLTARRQAAA